MAKKFADTSKLGLPKALDHEFKEFCRGLVDVYGPALKSITVYGSLARKEYFPERSDINVMVVLAEADLEALKKCLDVVARGREGCKVTPFFLTKEDIETSTDVFPIKFYDMKDAYEVIYGEDYLADLAIDDGNLRLEVEQEMKILVMELRQFYVQRARKGGATGAEHLLAYFNSFLYLLKRLLKLQGHDAPTRNEELIRVAAKRYELDVDFLKRMLDYKRGRPMKDSCAEAIPLYKAVAKAADIVDKLLV
jgi:predicted nucleotidyltransferase